MILSFSVSNYKSYKQTQRIKFVATRLSRHRENLIKTKNGRILRASLIYGHNASGKSNLLAAVHFSSRAILDGLNTINTDKKWFRLSPEQEQLPGRFTYQFQIEEERYVYQIEIDYKKKEFKREVLWRNHSTHKPRKIYERYTLANGITKTRMPDGKINENDATRLQIYLEDYSNVSTDRLRQQTILSDITSRTSTTTGLFAELQAIYNWFTKIIVIRPSSHYVFLNQLASRASEKQFFLDMLQEFDTGITDIKSNNKIVSIEELLQNINSRDPESKRQKLQKAIESKKPFFIRRGNDRIIVHMNSNNELVLEQSCLQHGNNSETFDFRDESDGTQRLLDFIPILDPANTDKIFFIDEIECSLHPNLVFDFLKLFLNKKKTSRCQLIATTHNTILMDLKVLRQDQIWFIKRRKDYSSCIYPLTQYQERFDLKINRNYLAGKYDKP